MRLPFSVQVFLVSLHESAPSVLLLQRNARPDLALPDFWQGVSGALESGESYEAAAVREVHEETSISLATVCSTEFEQVIPIKPEWRKTYGPRPTHVQEKVFFALVQAKQKPTLSPEHKAYRWCGEAEALKLLTFANNALCVQAVFRALRNAGA